MKREDFERIKEEEKKHLLEIRALKRQLKDAERLQRIGGALQNIQSAGDLEGFDSALEEVQRGAAEQEARLDLAVDSAASLDSVQLSDEDEETLKLARAADFVRQMKTSVGHETAPRSAPPPARSEKPESAEPERESLEETPDFEKTIGRMTPRDKRQ